jgi:DNA-binding winged helix-turn-helix (wHTH) protein
LIDQWLCGPAGLRLNPARRIAAIGEQPVALRRITFDLLQALLRHRGDVVSARHLVSVVWGYDETECFDVVDRVIARLERELRLAGWLDAIERLPGPAYRVRAWHPHEQGARPAAPASPALRLVESRAARRFPERRRDR